MNVKKFIWLVCLVCISKYLFGATLVVSDAKISRVQPYATQDDSVSARLFVNNSSRIGPNPDDTSVNCELWTYDKTVYSAAMSALLSGSRVIIRYVARGDDVNFCRVDYMGVFSE